MTKDRDWNVFCDCIRCAGILVGKEIPMAGLSMMFDLLSEYTIEQVQAAVAAHLKSSEGRFFPTPSHIIQQIEGTQAERLEYAWRVLFNAIAQYGDYDSVRFPEAAYHYAIDLLGGWIRLCNDDDLKFKRTEFMQLFQRGERVASFEPMQDKVTVKPYLMGYFEREYQRSRFTDRIQPVVEIATGRRIKQSELCPTAIAAPLHGFIAELSDAKRETV